MTQNVQFKNVINQIGMSHRRMQLCYIYLGVATVACVAAYFSYSKYKEFYYTNSMLQNNIKKYQELVYNQTDIIIEHKQRLAAQEKSNPDVSASNDTPAPPSA